MATPRSERAPGGIQTGTVTRIDVDGRPLVELPRMAVGFEFGPLLNAAGNLAVGDLVIVGFLEGLPDQPVVIGHVGGPDGAGEPPNLHASSHASGGGDPLTPAAIGAAAAAHLHPATDLTATGRTTTNFLRGDNTWDVPTDTNTTYAIPTQAEAEAGTATTARAFSAQRVAQAIAALAPVKAVRAIIAGTGLSGGGDLSADRTLSVLYGTTVGTAAVGNDARLSDARTPVAHSHAFAGTWNAIEGVTPIT